MVLKDLQKLILKNRYKVLVVSYDEYSIILHEIDKTDKLYRGTTSAYSGSVYLYGCLIVPVQDKSKVGIFQGSLDNTGETRQGWRYFECECGQKWRSTSRDASSPSGEDCECYRFIHPHNYIIDSTIEIDKSNNIKKYIRESL